MLKKYQNWILLIIFLVLVANLIKSWYFLQKRLDLVKHTQDKLEQVAQEHENLKRQLARVEADDYIEREARNKLNYTREGEVVILLPSISPISKPTPTPTEIPLNWLKWAKLFY